MKKCSKCQTENNPLNKFCGNCGSELDKPNNKLKLSEKRAIKESQTQTMLNKALLQESDLEDIKYIDKQHIVVKKVGLFNKIYKATILKLVVCILAVVLIFGMGAIVKYMTIHNNFKIAIAIALFFGGAISASYIVDLQYTARVYKSMTTSEFAIKKTTFGRPPTLKWQNWLYYIEVKQDCILCSRHQHIEQVQERLIVVCDQERTHLMEIDTAKLKESLGNQNI